MSFKCIIIDDDPLITDLVLHFADKCPDVEFCVSCNDAVEGLKLLSNDQFDVLFLDYNMPGLNGKALLELKQDHSKVIMITSHKEFAVESYQFDDVINFLVKPLSYNAFEEAIQRFKNRTTEERQGLSQQIGDFLMIKDGSKWRKVSIESIYFVKSESNYSTIYTLEDKIMSLINLKDLLLKLPDNFLRIHRSYIINTNHIEYLTAEDVSIHGTVLPISNNYKKDIKEYIKRNS